MPYCNRCGGLKQLPGDQCECGLVDTDIQDMPAAEPEPPISDDMLLLLCLMCDGNSRHAAETYFGESLREGYLRVRYMLAFLERRQYVAGWRITERGAALLRSRTYHEAYGD